MWTQGDFGATQLKAYKLLSEFHAPKTSMFTLRLGDTQQIKCNEVININITGNLYYKINSNSISKAHIRGIGLEISVLELPSSK